MRRSILLAAPRIGVALVLATVSIVTAPAAAWADPGGVDTSFGGGDGWSVTDIGDQVTAGALARTGDGHLLVAGSVDLNTSPRAYLARFAPDGTLDPTFGTGGVATGWTVDFGSGPTVAGWVTGLTVDPAGRALVMGWDGSGAYVAAFSANGGLDGSFAGDGVAEIAATRGYSITAEGNGNIVIGGESHGPTEGWGRVRLSSTGSVIDAHTGAQGRFDASDVNLPRLVPVPGGRWVGVGTLGGTPDHVQLRGFGPDLSVDASWGTGGAVAIGLGAFTIVEGATVDAAGRVIVAGTVSMDAFVLRTDASGALDPTFGSGGIVRIDTGVAELGRGVALDPAGRIYVVGDTSTQRPFVARLSPDGVIDTAFGTAGVARLDGVTPAGARAVTVLADGSVRAVGVGQVSGDWQVVLTGLLGGARSGPCDGTHGLTAQVCRLYRVALGRDPDVGGLAYWRRMRAGGTSLRAQATDMVRSDEFIARYGNLDDTAFVQLAYSNGLGRQADGPGLAYWVGRLGDGTSRGSVMAAFSELAELADTTGPGPVQSPAEGSVIRLYRAFFNRPPDSAGRAYWLSQLEAGVPLEAVADGFVASLELAGTYGPLDDADFVTQIYQNVFGRSPDPGGRSYWEARLAGGLSRSGMMTGFCQSAELRLLTDTV